MHTDALDSSLLVAERQIVSLIHRAARLADERRFLEWMELFAPDGVYAAITWENLNHKGLYLFKDIGRLALQERVGFLMGFWQVPRARTLHLVGNIELTSLEDDSAAALSNFIITRTADLEHSELHASGQYRDRFVRAEGRWLFAEREVVVDSNLLPPEFTELL